MEAANWNGPNLQRTSTRLGLRTEASGRFEKGLPPEQALWGQALAARLMVELCGARPVEGTIDVGGPGPSRPSSAARRPRGAAARRRLARASRRDDARAPRVRSSTDAADGLDVTVPHCAATTSPARPTSSRRSRGSAASSSCPRPCRRAAAPPGAYRRAAPAAPRSRTRSRAPGSEALGWSFERARPRGSPRAAGGDPRRAARARRTRCPRTSPSCARPCSGAARRGAPQPRTRRRRRPGCGSMGAVYLPRAGSGRAGPLPDRAPPLGARARRAPLRPAPLARARAAARRTSSPPRPCSRRCSTRCACRGARARARAVPAPRPHAGCSSAARPPAGSASCTPRSRPPGTSTPGRRLRARLRRRHGRRPGRPRLRGPHLLPGGAPGPRRGRRRTTCRPRGPRRRARGRRPAAAPRRGLRRLPRRPGGEGRASLALRLEFRAPDRTLTDEEVAARRERIVAALAELGGELRG